MAEAAERGGRALGKYVSPVTEALSSTSDVAGSLAARGAGAAVASDAERGVERIRQVAQTEPENVAKEHFLEAMSNPSYMRAVMEEENEPNATNVVY